MIQWLQLKKRINNRSILQFCTFFLNIELILYWDWINNTHLLSVHTATSLISRIFYRALFIDFIRRITWIYCYVILCHTVSINMFCSFTWKCLYYTESIVLTVDKACTSDTQRKTMLYNVIPTPESQLLGIWRLFKYDNSVRECMHNFEFRIMAEFKISESFIKRSLYIWLIYEKSIFARFLMWILSRIS